eukprot:6214714-Pleurochrysis_carterae.AAC.1
MGEYIGAVFGVLAEGVPDEIDRLEGAHRRMCREAWQRVEADAGAEAKKGGKGATARKVCLAGVDGEGQGIVGVVGGVRTCSCLKGRRYITESMAVMRLLPSERTWRFVRESSPPICREDGPATGPEFVIGFGPA